MPVAFTERRVERGIHIVEDRYTSGLVEIGFYPTASRNRCLCIVERQPGSRKWHLFGLTGNRPILSVYTKAAILKAAVEYASSAVAAADAATTSAA